MARPYEGTSHRWVSQPFVLLWLGLGVVLVLVIAVLIVVWSTEGRGPTQPRSFWGQPRAR